LAASLTLPDKREIQIIIGEHYLLASTLDHLMEPKKQMWSPFLRSKKRQTGGNLLLSTSSMSFYPLTQRKR